VKVLGTTNLPAQGGPERSGDGHLDAQWVEIEGVIQHVILRDGHLRLRLMTPRGKFNVLIPGFHNQTAPTNLVDAFVSLQGACASEMNARQQVIGATIACSRAGSDQNPGAGAGGSILRRHDAHRLGGTFDPDHLAGRRVKSARGYVENSDQDSSFRTLQTAFSCASRRRTNFKLAMCWR